MNELAIKNKMKSYKLPDFEDDCMRTIYTSACSISNNAEEIKSLARDIVKEGRYNIVMHSHALRLIHNLQECLAEITTNYDAINSQSDLNLN